MHGAMRKQKALNTLFADGLAKGTVPTSIRFSGMLLARVDELAEQQGGDADGGH